jgi:hypothetical protein
MTVYYRNSVPLSKFRGTANRMYIVQLIFVFLLTTIEFARFGHNELGFFLIGPGHSFPSFLGGPCSGSPVPFGFTKTPKGPTGMSFVTVANFAWLGPFRSEIRDYHAPKSTSSRPERRTGVR